MKLQTLLLYNYWLFRHVLKYIKISYTWKILMPLIEYVLFCNADSYLQHGYELTDDCVQNDWKWMVAK